MNSECVAGLLECIGNSCYHYTKIGECGWKQQQKELHEARERRKRTRLHIGCEIRCKRQPARRKVIR